MTMLATQPGIGGGDSLLGGLARRRVLFHEAAEVIRRDFGDAGLTVDAVARRVYSSRRQLQRAFTEAGTTVRGYLFEVRMRHAAELLARGEHPVATVSRLVGYRQPAQFAKAFARRYGMPPSRWRAARRASVASAASSSTSSAAGSDSARA